MTAHRTFCRLHRAFAVAIATSLAPSAAFAQAPPVPVETTPSSEARAHFDRGVAFYSDADYSAALVEFTRAYALAPNWQVLFNVGQASFQVHDYARAVVTLKQFIDGGQDRIPQERRALVEGELGDLAHRVGHVAIACNLVGATILVDDAAVGVAPLREAVLVSAGVRKITAVSDGHEPVERRVSVPAGETVDVDLAIYEPPTAAAPAPGITGPAHNPPVPRSPSRNHTSAFTAFGLAAAGVSAGVVFGALALHDKSRLDGECVGKACAPGSQGDIDAVARDGAVSTGAFGVAAAGAVAGVILWFTAGGSTSGSRDGQVSTLPASSTSLRWAPGFVAGTF